MRHNLNDLADIEKLQYAIDCVQHGIAFPGAIQDFLEQHSLLESIRNPKVTNVNARKATTKGKPRVRSRPTA